MMRRLIALTVLAPVLFLAACQSPAQSGPAKRATDREIALDQGYALLYATLSDESQVDKLLIIKDPGDPVAELIKAISRFTGEAKSKIDAFAKVQPMLALTDQGLPVTETNTRKAIGDATAKGLLFSGDRTFEFRALLSQHQALSYITHLAETLADQEPVEDRRRFLEKLAKDADALHDRVIALLETPYVGRGK